MSEVTDDKFHSFWVPFYDGRAVESFCSTENVEIRKMKHPLSLIIYPFKMRTRDFYRLMVKLGHWR
jgi:hypothetical protein